MRLQRVIVAPVSDTQGGVHHHDTGERLYYILQQLSTIYLVLKLAIIECVLARLYIKRRSVILERQTTWQLHLAILDCARKEHHRATLAQPRCPDSLIHLTPAVLYRRVH